MPDPRTQSKTTFENSAPILRVANMKTTLHYYLDVLGFRNADWGDDNFTCVNRDAAGIYLCCGGQGSPNTWIWVGVQDVQALYEEYRLSGAKVRHEPRNYSWALEMHVEDPDGHVIRFGSEPISGRPFDDWLE
jgi:catechol 2,3-dioxygenase-like lactoylglutathione lyase family enzyme